MVDVIWVRHGMSYQNVGTALDHFDPHDARVAQMKRELASIDQGTLRSELTPEGYMQAGRVGEHLAKFEASSMVTKIGRVACSWMPRAILTAYTMTQRWSVPPTIYVVPYIQETHNPAPSRAQIEASLRHMGVSDRVSLKFYRGVEPGSIHDMARFRTKVLPGLTEGVDGYLVVVSHGNLLARHVEPYIWSNTSAWMQRIDGLQADPARPVYINHDPVVHTIDALYQANW